MDDPDDPDRFNSLESGDFVVFEFIGDLSPNAAKAMFIARALPEDQALHSEFEKTLGLNRMVAIDPDGLGSLIGRADTPDNHPINELTLDEALEDVALGGSEGAERLLRRKSGRKLTKEQLARAKERVDEVGQQGEAYVNLYLIDLQRGGHILDFEWVSKENAISPYDFRIVENDVEVFGDAKSTLGAFERPLHISLFELREMAQGTKRYDLYRIFEMSDHAANLRICVDTREIARRILDAFESLPNGVSVDAVSVAPKSLPFGDPVSIIFEDNDLEPPQI